ncbi:MAG: ATP-binding protein [Bacteroidales bacterium]|nr:ATP-binding protein [Bacteroidales bacterium]
MSSRTTKNTSLRIALIFLIVGLLWIFFSDLVSNSLFEDTTSIVNFQMMKGAFFVLSTALLIYFLVNRELRRKNHLIEFLNKSEHWYNLMVSNIPNVDIYLFDPDGRLILSQGSVLPSMGVNLDEVTGKFIEESSLTERTKNHIKPLINSVLSGVKVEDVYDYEDKYFQISGLGLQNEKKVIFAGLIVVTDVTDLYNSIDELKLKRQEFQNLYKEYYHQNSLLIQQNIDLQELNEQLKKARESAEESDRLKTSFLTNMSHEIRTPLNGIIGFSQIIASDQLDKEEIFEYSRIISQSGQKLLTIIDDVLLMAQLESGQYDFKLKSVCVERVWTEIQHVATEFFSRKEYRRRLLVNFDKTLFHYEVKLDKDAIMRVLVRLLDNAVKFSNDDTPIRLGLLRSEDNALDIYVEDEGIGIPKDQIPEMFKRFTQLHADDLTPLAGNGLGLSIVKEIVDLINAEIFVNSTPGTGTRFLIRIPVNYMNLPKATIDMKDMSNLPKARKILIVEDVRDNFVLIRAYLKNYLVDLHHVVTATDAKNFIEKNPDIDLIMMDIRLPDGNGIELTKKLRKNQILCPIIAQTAYADSHDKHLCLEAGCNDYLAKPIHKANFIDTLKHYLELEPITA